MINYSDSKFQKQFMALWVLLLLSTSIMGQTYQWTKMINPLDSGQIMAQDVSSSGDFYIASYKKRKHTQSPFGIMGKIELGEVVLSKYDSSGNITWSNTWSGSRARVFQLVVDNQGDILLSGGYYDSLRIDQTHQYAGSSINSGSFIMKYDSTGSLKWAKVNPSVQFANFVSFSFQIHDTLIIESGRFSGYNPSLRKLNSNGDTLATLALNSSIRIVSDIDINSNGDVFIAGGALGNAKIGNLALPKPPNNRGYMNFVAKLNLNLTPSWVRTTNHATIDESNQVEAFGNGVAFLSNDFPSGMLTPHTYNLKFYDSLGNQQSTDSVSNAWQFSSEGRLGLSKFQNNLLLTRTTGDTLVELIKIDVNRNYSLLATIHGGTLAAFPVGRANARSLIYTTSFYTSMAVVNGSQTFQNPAGSTSQSGLKNYKQLVLKFGLTPCNISSSQSRIVSCDPVQSPSGKFIWSKSGQYLDTLVNSTGCDSLITVDLLILSSQSTDTLDACDALTSPSGKFTWTHSGSYSDTLTNTLGCDSVLMLKVNITKVDTSISALNNVLRSRATESSYQWINCDSRQPIVGATDSIFTPTKNGNYAVVVTSGNCKDTSTCLSVTTLFLGGGASQKSTHLYPNPTSGQIHFNEAIDYVLINSIGVEMSRAKNVEQAYFGSLKPGIYYLIANEKEIHKVVIR